MGYGEPLKDKEGLSEFEGRDSVDLLARMIYAEARGESLKGKKGCAHVAKNRKAKNSTEFGGDTYAGVLLRSGAFAGMTTKAAREPDLKSDAWKECLDIASNMSTTTNPIGKCLWFVTNDYFAKHSRVKDGKEQYLFSAYCDVVEKVVIGNHTFFRVSGY